MEEGREAQKGLIHIIAWQKPAQHCKACAYMLSRFSSNHLIIVISINTASKSHSVMSDSVPCYGL